MKMCIAGYHRSGFLANHALGHMMWGHVPKCMSCHKATVVINIYICIYVLSYLRFELEIQLANTYVNKSKYQ